MTVYQRRIPDGIDPQVIIRLLEPMVVTVAIPQ